MIAAANQHPPMRPMTHFRFCPRCGRELPKPTKPNCLGCAACGFTYYFNPTVSAAALVLREDGRALFFRRTNEPAKGKLAVPGGFVDFDETAEDALRREIREEVGLEVGALEFLCSHTNDYAYKSVTYPVVDLFFVTRPFSTDARPLDGAEGCCWLDPRQVRPEDVAFPSVIEALRRHNARAG